jgi:hypothetical protein
MTDVLITVDTEMRSSLHRKGLPASDNIASSIFGRTASGAFGIGWQMDRMDDHGLKGVFFVDPMPALVYGEAILADIVGPIVSRGHDVQLHIHTEWLEWASSAPVGDRRGRSIGDFSRDDQHTLLSLARGLIERAGAPAPIAFRAGNFGANDDTISVLAELGIAWDSSVNADYLGHICRIDFDPDRNMPIEYRGLIELPVSGLVDTPGHFRPAQICAISTWEMRAALEHAVYNRHVLFNIVTHSFEMLSRDRQRPNRSVTARFNALCRTIADTPGLRSVRFADLDAATMLGDDKSRLGPNRLRTWLRLGEQAVATWAYERRLRPA